MEVILIKGGHEISLDSKVFSIGQCLTRSHGPINQGVHVGEANEMPGVFW